MVINHCVKRVTLLFFFFLCVDSSRATEEILNGEILNNSLKQMQRLQSEIEAASTSDQAEKYFELGILSGNLALLLTSELNAYGFQQEGLMNLALSRTDELGINILWFPDKYRFVYDGAAFKRYLEIDPHGQFGGESAFRLIESQFYQSDSGDIDSILVSIKDKESFLEDYPKHSRVAKVAMFLAIDYRDLWRHYNNSGENPDKASYYSERTQNQFNWIVEEHSNSEEAGHAASLLRRFTEESNTNM